MKKTKCLQSMRYGQSNTIQILFSISFPILLLSCSTLPEQDSKVEMKALELSLSAKDLSDYLAQRLIKSKHNTGIIVGIIQSGKDDQIYSYGYADAKTKAPITKDTLFQIGSITKAFTAHLLGIQVQAGKIDLDGPIDKYIGNSFEYTDRRLGQLTPRMLALNKANFPFIHQTWELRWNALKFIFSGNNIWSNCTSEYFLNYVSTMNFDNGPNFPFKYSSLGYTFLAWIVGQSDESKDYEFLINEKILKPLSLDDTVFTLSDDQSKRLATGYVGEYPPLMFRGTELAPWILHPGTRGGGGLFSSMNDLLEYLKYQMGILKTDSYDAMLITQKQLVDLYKEGEEGGSWFGGDIEEDKTAGMGWFAKSYPDINRSIIFIRGTISGYKSFMGFDKYKKIGVIVLENDLNSSDNVGMMLLRLLIKGTK